MKARADPMLVLCEYRKPQPNEMRNWGGTPSMFGMTNHRSSWSTHIRFGDLMCVPWLAPGRDVVKGLSFSFGRKQLATKQNEHSDALNVQQFLQVEARSGACLYGKPKLVNHQYRRRRLQTIVNLMKVRLAAKTPPAFGLGGVPFQLLWIITCHLETAYSFH